VAHGLAAQQRAQRRERLVGAAAARLRIDAADLDLVRSSPPTPTPSTSRPGADSHSVAIWRATGTGCRSASR
jgi:hypothetical protein